jgi:hypothetical protein
VYGYPPAPPRAPPVSLPTRAIATGYYGPSSQPPVYSVPLVRAMPPPMQIQTVPLTSLPPRGPVHAPAHQTTAPIVHHPRATDNGCDCWDICDILCCICCSILCLPSNSFRYESRRDRERNRDRPM